MTQPNLASVSDSPSALPARPRPLSAWSRRLRLKEFGIVYVLIAIALFLALRSPVFLQPQNLINIVRQSSVVGILAVGTTFLLATGQFDLSIGAQAGLTGVIVLLTLPSIGLIPAIMLTYGVAAVIGVVTGWLITRVGISSLVTTLGTLSILRGLLLILTDGRYIQAQEETLKWFANGLIGPLPVPVVLFLGLVVVAEFVLNRTRYGRLLLATGGNKEASRLAGLRVDRLIMSAFVLSSCCAVTAGLVLLGRVYSANATNGIGLEFNAVTAAVLGGTSIFGGEGSVWKTLVGVLLLQVLSNGFNLLNVGAYYQDLIQGLIMIGAVALYTYQRRRQ